MATSYSNTGGRGDRSALITVTSSSGLFYNGTAQQLVDGVISGTSGITRFAGGVTNGWIRFDFGEASRVVIDSFIIWMISGGMGTWRWYGGNFDTIVDSFVPLGNAFNLHGAGGGGPVGSGFEFHEPAGNGAGFRFYELRQVGGVTLDTYVREFEFKIAALADGASEPVSDSEPGSDSDPFVAPSESQSALPSEAPIEPAYTEPGGTGNRAGQVWVSVNGFLIGGGDIMFSGGQGESELVDGTNDDSIRLRTGTDNGEFIFDFGPLGFYQRITEFRWIQSAAQSQGTWSFEGSQNAVNWDTLKAGINLGSGGATHTEAITNPTGFYRFYRLKQTGGVCNQNAFVRQVEFKIARGDAILYAMPVLMSGERKTRITVTSDLTVTFGTIANLVGSGNIEWTSSTNKQITFDFGQRVAINFMRWSQGNNASHGICQWIASNDPTFATFDTLGSPFLLAGQPGGGFTHYGRFSGNTRGYQLYRLLMGAPNPGVTVTEIEFRESPIFFDATSESELFNSEPPSSALPSEPPSSALPSEPPSSALPSEPPSSALPSEPPPSESDPALRPVIQVCVVAVGV